MTRKVGPQSQTITVPANTSENSPVEATFEIGKSILTKVSIHFPDGCIGLVKCAIFYGEEQILPTEAGQYFNGNAETVEMSCYIPLPDDPTTLTVKAWSPGTSYDHNIIVRLETQPEFVAGVGGIIHKFVEAFRRLIGL